MLNGQAGQFSSISGLTAAQQLALDTNINATSPPSIKATNYSVVAADVGLTFINTGAAGAVQFTIPAGLALGSVLSFLQDSNAQNLVIKLSGSETARLGTVSVTAAAGTLTYLGAASASLGCFIALKKLTSTAWAVTNVVGAVPTLA